MSEMLDVIEAEGVAQRVLQDQSRHTDLTYGEGSVNYPGSNTVDTSSLNQDSVHGDSFPEGTSQAPGLQDRAQLTEDPESPRDIVEANVLVLFPLALFFVFLVCGLVIAFSE